MTFGGLRTAFVEHVYADHNASAAVRRQLAAVLARLGPGQRGLNVGARLKRLHARVVNLDIAAGVAVDCRGSALALPFPDGTFDLVVTQETLEHVPNPFLAVGEIVRVLRRGGVLYCQLPFVIGFHPGPHDFWRFTVEGIRELVERAGLSVTVIATSVGGASGYYRISVEFWSGLLSLGRRPFYRGLKALFALLLYPIKWLDAVFAWSPERDRIAGGYLVVATKD